MVPRSALAALTLIGITGTAVLPHETMAQTNPAGAQKGFTDQELERMSQERLRDMPKRDWGPPVPQSAVPHGPKLSPLPEPATCLSTTSEDEPILASPNFDAKRIGIAPGRIAATGVHRGAFTKVLYTGTRRGWIPTSHLVPFRATGGGSATLCAVSGVAPDGMIAYHVD
ncbi:MULTISPECIES: hypothetical protein [Asaia]|uniref:SH3 domain-containing protein n=1 Tax=Asaia bogorensis TaxID=91915 RepID=A0A060QM75_9PROT|nr:MULTISPECIES: hypothetical protein [Asaia]ETC99277.1 hypothetical protein P792_04915 [Asaia sp. SF2.1]CDG41037.1 hypothetical protein ASAP_2992 [Asaia bogorensis]